MNVRILFVDDSATILPDVAWTGVNDGFLCVQYTTKYKRDHYRLSGIAGWFEEPAEATK